MATDLGRFGNGSVEKPRAGFSRRYGPLCLVAMLVITGSFAPGIRSMFLYLYHSRDVRFHKCQIPVPIGWELDSLSDGRDDVVLRKTPPSVFQREYYSTMIFTSVPREWITSPQAGYSVWETLVNRSFQDDFVDIRKQRLCDNSSPCDCVTGTFRRDGNLRHVDCLLLKNEVRAEFIGTSESASKFFWVIDKISR